jgi:hypothetical protein
LPAHFFAPLPAHFFRPLARAFFRPLPAHFFAPCPHVALRALRNILKISPTSLKLAKPIAPYKVKNCSRPGAIVQNFFIPILQKGMHNLNFRATFAFVKSAFSILS